MADTIPGSTSRERTVQVSRAELQSYTFDRLNPRAATCRISILESTTAGVGTDTPIDITFDGSQLVSALRDVHRDADSSLDGPSARAVAIAELDRLRDAIVKLAQQGLGID